MAGSSTISIVKHLPDKREVDSSHGRSALDFLIVQGIAGVIAAMGMDSRGAIATHCIADGCCEPHSAFRELALQDRQNPPPHADVIVLAVGRHACRIAARQIHLGLGVVSTLHQTETNAALTRRLRHHGFRRRLTLTARTEQDAHKLQAAHAHATVLRGLHNAADFAAKPIAESLR